MQSVAMEAYLRKIYNDPKSEGGYSSASRLYRVAKRKYPDLTFDRVREFLKTEDAYTLHKQARRRFKRGKVITGKFW